MHNIYSRRTTMRLSPILGVLVLLTVHIAARPVDGGGSTVHTTEHSTSGKAGSHLTPDQKEKNIKEYDQLLHKFHNTEDEKERKRIAKEMEHLSTGIEEQVVKAQERYLGKQLAEKQGGRTVGHHK